MNTIGALLHAALLPLGVRVAQILRSARAQAIIDAIVRRLLEDIVRILGMARDREITDDPWGWYNEAEARGQRAEKTGGAH